MVRFISRWRMPCALPAAWLAGLWVSALTAQAQPAARAARPDPLDAQAGVPTPTYESSFSQYRRLGDERPASWREANDTVTRLGGWRVYAREAQQPDPAPVTKPADPSPAANPPDRAPAAMPTETAKPVPPGHGGHKMP